MGTAVAEKSPLAKFDEGALKAIATSNVDSGAPRAMFAPSSMGEAMELAKLMAAGNFVPKHLRGKPGDCLAVIMQSARWGMDPFAVGNKTYFVGDKMAYEAQLVSAVVNSSNVLEGRLKVEWSGEGSSLECLVTGRVKGDPDPKTRRVKLSTITTRNSPLWKQDPEQQLAYFAQRAWARLHTPEVLLGVYTPEELEVAPSVAEAIVNSAEPLTAAMIQEQAEAGDDEPETVEAEIITEERIGGESLFEKMSKLSKDAQGTEAQAIDQTPLEEADLAQQTLDDIDGSPEQDSPPEQLAAETSDPREAKFEELKKAINATKEVIDLENLYRRERNAIDALTDEQREVIMRRFETAKGTFMGKDAG